MSEKKRILIVEDEVINAISLQMDLLHLGYQGCEIESTGETAIAAVKTAPPDLILMDLNMDGAEGVFQTAEEIHKTHALPIIFLSESNDEETLKNIAIIKNSTYLIKPVSTEDVVAKIKELI